VKEPETGVKSPAGLGLLSNRINHVQTYNQWGCPSEQSKGLR